MTILITLLLSAGLTTTASQNYKTAGLIATIEQYTGESYVSGDCETKEIYEADDLKVLQACDALEN
jgi:hypothetical protein